MNRRYRVEIKVVELSEKDGQPNETIINTCDRFTVSDEEIKAVRFCERLAWNRVTLSLQRFVDPFVNALANRWEDSK